VRHSQADVGKARRLLSYVPTHDLRAGLGEALSWYIARFAPEASESATTEVRGAA
jgi:UDP-N-acetylglucosamine 4-epimerase